MLVTYYVLSNGFYLMPVSSSVVFVTRFS